MRDVRILPPRLPRWLELVLLAALVWQIFHPAPTPVRGAFFWILLQVIWTGVEIVAHAIQTAGGYVGEAIKWIWGNVQTLGQAIATGLAKTGAFFKEIGVLVKSLWVDIVAPFATQVYNWLKQLGGLLKAWFKPVIDFLLKVRKEISKFYNAYIKPIIDVIDIVRKGLRILGSLGVDWATALEKRLAQVEQKINEPFLLITKKINEVLGWIDKIVTLDGFLQKAMLFTSLFTYRRSASNFIVNTMSGPTDAGLLADYNSKYPRATAEKTASDLVKAFKGEESYIATLGDTWAEEYMLLGK